MRGVWLMCNNHRTGPDLPDADSMWRIVTTVQANLSLIWLSFFPEKIYLKVKKNPASSTSADILSFTAVYFFFLPQFSSHSFAIRFFYSTANIEELTQHNAPSCTFSSLHHSIEELLAPNVARFFSDQKRRRCVEMRHSLAADPFDAPSAEQPANPAVQ